VPTVGFLGCEGKLDRKGIVGEAIVGEAVVGLEPAHD